MNNPLDVVLTAAGGMLAAAGLYLFISQGRPEAAVAAAVALLATGHFIRLAQREHQLTGRLDDLFDAFRKSEREQRLAQQEQTFVPPAPAPQPVRRAEPPPVQAFAPKRPEPFDFAREIEDIRAGIQNLVPGRDRGQNPAPRRVRRIDEDRLDFYLEPIVAFDTGVTLHYRVSLSLQAADGHRVEHAALFAEADRSGLRPSLDTFAASRVAPALARIRRKRPGVSIFLPVGSITLGNASKMAELMRNLAGSSSGLVIEIDHATLAGLGPIGLKSLASLAQSGAVLSLARCNPNGVDLRALAELGFSYLFFDVPTTAAANPSIARLAVFAADQGFEIGVAGIASDAEANIARRWARLGRGTYFAPPRLVRAELYEDLQAAA
jgi:EAL domain-containing protein (putative c-di-GMP-specific phosphodiesterase class I)